MNPKIAHYALMAGLCSLVPIPFLDDWLERKATRHMFATLATDAGVTLDEATLDVLTEDRSSLLLGCLGTMVIWPIKKLFRTVLYFLTVKDVIDGVAAASLRASMLHAALLHLPDRARAVRDVMDATLGRWQYSPVSRTVFRGERPAAEWIVNDDGVGRAVGWIFEKAGGRPIVDDFVTRLEAIP